MKAYFPLQILLPPLDVAELAIVEPWNHEENSYEWPANNYNQVEA